MECDGLFEVGPRRREIALRHPASHPGGAMSDAGRRRPGKRPGFVHHGVSGFLHRLRFAAHVAADPKSVIRRNALNRIVDGGGEFARAQESRSDVGRMLAVRLHCRIGQGNLQAESRRRTQGFVSGALVRHGDRFAEMRNRLLEGRAAQSLVARLAPPLDGEIVETRLGEMMRDRLGLGVRVA